jgi:N-acetylmuramoyl-L-alanine amidase
VQVTHPSPNHSARPAGVIPSLLVLHATAGRDEQSDVYWCCQPESRVSYHLIVGRKGKVYVLVPFVRRAWHAGVSSWNGRANVNDYSLGLAFANRHNGEERLTDVQIAVMQALIQGLRDRYRITDVVTHAMVAPQRKDDPARIPNFSLADYAAP